MQADLQPQDGAAPVLSLRGIVKTFPGVRALGGVRLDLRQFFTWTGIFIVFVAAGLFSSALRSLHEAGLWNHLQQPLYDLTRVLPVSSVPGTVLSGLLGYHDRPTVGEALGWALVVLGGLWFFLRPTPAPRLRVQG